MNIQSKKFELCVIKYAALENNRAYLLRTVITKSHLSNRICQHYGVKTSTVIPSFYYVFNNIQATISAFWLVKNMSINPKSVQKSVIECKNV